MTYFKVPLILLIFLSFTLDGWGQYVVNRKASYYERNHISRIISCSDCWNPYIFSFDRKGRVIEIKDSTSYGVNYDTYDSLGRLTAHYSLVAASTLGLYDTVKYVTGMKYNSNGLLREFIKVSKDLYIDKDVQYSKKMVFRNDSLWEYKVGNMKAQLVALTIFEIDTIPDKYISREFTYFPVENKMILQSISIEEYTTKWQLASSYGYIPQDTVITTYPIVVPPKTGNWFGSEVKTYTIRKIPNSEKKVVPFSGYWYDDPKCFLTAKLFYLPFDDKSISEKMRSNPSHVILHY